MQQKLGHPVKVQAIASVQPHKPVVRKSPAVVVKPIPRPTAAIAQQMRQAPKPLVQKPIKQM